MCAMPEVPVRIVTMLEALEAELVLVCVLRDVWLVLLVRDMRRSRKGEVRLAGREG